MLEEIFLFSGETFETEVLMGIVVNSILFFLPFKSFNSAFFHPETFSNIKIDSTQKNEKI